MKSRENDNAFASNTPNSRIRQIATLAALIVATAAIAHAVDRRNAPNSPPAAWSAPQIEVAFVLDTTGSMSGLIEGAKHKVWSIVNQLADGSPRPRIRVGLIGYRDRGDDYVTRRFDLTEDIDSIYRELLAFQAAGGGDSPESVNQALHEAVGDLSWSNSQQVYRVIFLVGDAPPHAHDRNEVPYRESVRRARAKGIAVNTIQCGDLPATRQVWRDIAQIGSGEYTAISQTGGMLALETPVDDALAELNQTLSDTALAYGSRAEQDELRAKLHAASSAPGAVASARLGYLEKTGAGLVSGMKDLVEAVDEGLDLAAAPEAELPVPMQEMDLAERESFVAKKRSERQALRAQIATLNAKRDDYVKQELSRRRASGKADGFDQKVLDTIRRQAETAGIAYE